MRSGSVRLSALAHLPLERLAVAAVLDDPAAATLTGESSLARALAWAAERGRELPREVIRGRAASA